VDVLVIGGGLIGLSIAYSAANKGLSVTVIDLPHEGQASVAAAGMLAPLAESLSQTPLVPLAIKSLRLWPLFIDQLRDDATAELVMNGPGTLRLAHTSQEELGLLDAFMWQKAMDMDVECVSNEELHGLEPALNCDIRFATLSPQEKHVDPRVVLSTLREACCNRGVKLLVNEMAQEFTSTDLKIDGVRLKGSIMVCADHYVVAGGAWSQPLLEPLYHLPVVPVKGQAASLGPFERTPFAHTLYSQHGYLLPRPNGTVYAGATEEHSGYDGHMTVEGVESQRKIATTMVPCLESAPLQRGYSGLRPVSPDGRPILGNIPGWDNLHVATGHGRNGVLLTPLTGQLMAEHLTKTNQIPKAFAVSRFSNS
jgi:glycine oxidase